MTAAIDLLPQGERAEVTPVFVTLVPTRATSAVTARYVDPLRRRFVMGSGPLEAVDHFANRKEILSVRHVPDAAGEYSVDHTNEVLLFGLDGRQIERFP